MILDDLASHLSGLGTIGKDLLPATPDTAFAVYLTAGQAPVHTMVAPHVMERPRVQVVSRSASLQTAHSGARSAYDLLNGMREKTINGVQYLWITAVQEPFLFGKDLNGRYLVACNYDVAKARTT